MRKLISNLSCRAPASSRDRQGKQIRLLLALGGLKAVVFKERSQLQYV